MYKRQFLDNSLLALLNEFKGVPNKETYMASISDVFPAPLSPIMMLVSENVCSSSFRPLKLLCLVLISLNYSLIGITTYFVFGSLGSVINALVFSSLTPSVTSSPEHAFTASMRYETL